MPALLIFIGLVVFSVLLTAVALRIAGKLFKYGKPGFGRAGLVAVIALLLGVGFKLPQLWMPSSIQLAYGLGILAVQLLILAFMIKRVHRTTTGRAWAGVGFVMAAQVVYLVIALLVVRRYLVEAYQTPTNSMAPALLGLHQVNKCPACGGPLFVDEPEPEWRARLGRFADDEPRYAICGKCYHREEISPKNLSGQIMSNDRIMVTKFLEPRRWDVVAHYMPRGEIFMKRLVALPGESVMIKSDGSIVIDGKLIGSPPNLPGLTFPWPPGRPDQALTPDVPLQLGADEYFLIGDNSVRSYDSRSYGPIHRKDIIGVVSAIYWPVGRMRIVR